jgi:nucleotide-binding universal stress UspA family protein
METAAAATDEFDVRIVVLQHETTGAVVDRIDRSSIDPRFRIDVRASSTNRIEHGVLRHLAQEPCDLVLVGEGHFDRSSSRRSLVRRLRVPVWVVPTVGRLASVVAVAVGPFAGDGIDEHHRHLIETAATLARRRNGRLHVVHAWRLDGETLMRSARIRAPRDELTELKHEAAWRARRRLSSVVRSVRLDGVAHEISVEQGDPDRVLTRFVDRRSVRDLVVGSVARTGVSGLVIGNTAERLEVAGNSLLVVPKDAASDRQPVRGG